MAGMTNAHAYPTEFGADVLVQGTQSIVAIIIQTNPQSLDPLHQFLAGIEVPHQYG